VSQRVIVVVCVSEIYEVIWEIVYDEIEHLCSAVEGKRFEQFIGLLGMFSV